MKSDQKNSDKTQTFAISGRTLTFITRAGVFAQYGLDYGSKLLLDQLPVSLTGTVLDLGTGCGFLGISIASVSPEATVHMVDADIRAIRLAEQNAKHNDIDNVQIYISDVVQDIDPTIRFDTVVSNPPTHQGRDTLIEFIQGSHTVLNKRGTLYMVVNRMTSTASLLEDVFKNAQKLKKKQGYIVYKAIK